MNFLLDTHIFLWWHLNSTSLSKQYLELLEGCVKDNKRIGLSIMSQWEIAKLVSISKLEIQFSIDTWFEEIENDSRFELLPLNSSIILESTRLGKNFHKDPVDQIIVATARIHGLKLMTSDKKIINSNLVSIA